MIFILIMKITQNEFITQSYFFSITVIFIRRIIEYGNVMWRYIMGFVNIHNWPWVMEMAGDP